MRYTAWNQCPASPAAAAFSRNLSAAGSSMTSGRQVWGCDGWVWITSAPMPRATSTALSMPPRVETCPPMSTGSAYCLVRNPIP